METLAPASWRRQVLLYMAVTLSLVMSLVGGDSSACTPTINMARQRFGKSPGKSLILKCPIRLCYLGLPNVTWCKITGELCEPVRTGEGIYSSVEELREDSAVYLLKFESVQINDTGYYQCRANFKKQQIVGRAVEIYVSEDNSSCTPEIKMAGHQKFDKSAGESLILKCPMRLCDLGLPNVTWCKITGEMCEPVRTGEGIYSSMEEQEEDSAVYVLKFESVQVKDTGYYQCRAIYKEQQIVGSTVAIAISAQPSPYLKLNSAGSPECGAIGGNPPAEISWIPHSDDIRTTVVEEPDQTWSMISTFSRKRMKETSVTCVVSHPTLVNPWEQVIALNAKPSAFLKLNSAGSPECGAIGGNPPAEISWIPHLDDIRTTVVEEPDQTWSVISTFSRKRMKETSVTCVVSHPMLVNPWKKVIELNGYKLRFHNIVRIIVTVIITVLLVGFLLYLKAKSQGQNIPGEQNIED